MSFLSSTYFRPKSFERTGRLYVCLGIRPFKKGITLLGHALVQRSYFLQSRSIESVRSFERRTRKSELVHLLGTVGPAIALLLSDGSGAVATSLLALVMVANLYPFMLQRYNRVRLQRVLDRADREGR